MGLLFTIGGLARGSGCSVDAIRYYERKRLMPRVPRTEGGHRLYDRRHAARLAFIRRCRELGLSVEQVRDLLDGIDREACGCGEIRAVLQNRAAAVKRQLVDLQKLERSLHRMIGVCGDATTADCRVVNVLVAGGDPAPGDVVLLGTRAQDQAHRRRRFLKPGGGSKGSKGAARRALRRARETRRLRFVLGFPLLYLARLSACASSHSISTVSAPW